jgi:hypothetical protein
MPPSEPAAVFESGRAHGKPASAADYPSIGARDSLLHILITYVK